MRRGWPVLNVLGMAMVLGLVPCTDIAEAQRPRLQIRTGLKLSKTSTRAHTSLGRILGIIARTQRRIETCGETLELGEQAERGYTAVVRNR
jgi:hypothetical protein